jgi:hypothetical protein
MATIKHIGPGSAFKIGLVLYGFMGLLLGILFALVSKVGGSFILPAEASVWRMFFGVGAIVFMPICYGILGGVFGAIGAVVYNLVAGWVGGLEVDIN